MEEDVEGPAISVFGLGFNWNPSLDVGTGAIRCLENDAPFFVNHPAAGGLDLLRDLDAARELHDEQGRNTRWASVNGPPVLILYPIRLWRIRVTLGA